MHDRHDMRSLNWREIEVAIDEALSAMDLIQATVLVEQYVQLASDLPQTEPSSESPLIRSRYLAAQVALACGGSAH